jgi:hypothetical protein
MEKPAWKRRDNLARSWRMIDRSFVPLRSPFQPPVSLAAGADRWSGEEMSEKGHMRVGQRHPMPPGPAPKC